MAPHLGAPPGVSPQTHGTPRLTTPGDNRPERPGAGLVERGAGVDVASDLVPLEKATVLFMSRLLVAFREGASMYDIETTTGLPERLVNDLIVAATEAQ